MPLPAVAAVGARLVAPILGRVTASVASRGAMSTVGRMAATKAGTSAAMGLVKGGPQGFADLDNQVAQTSSASSEIDTGSLLDMSEMPSMGRSECFGMGCSS